MANISKIACDSLKPYTQNGCRLVMKKTSHVSGCMPKDIVPKNCAFIDFVRAETNFGRGSTNIVTFKDKYGGFIKRVISKKLGEDTESIVKTYNKDDNILFVTSKQYKNKKNIRNTEEAIYRPNIFSKRITRMKLDMDLLPDGSRVEKQVYEELAPRTRGKYLETTALRSKEGTLSKKTIKAGDDYILEKVKDDPYLYIRNYNNKDFAHTASLYAAEKQGVKELEGGFYDKKLEDCSGLYKNATKDVIIDSFGRNKPEIVDTLNHEYRHKLQQNLISKIQLSLLNIFRRPENKILLNPDEKKLAKKFWFAIMEYPSFKSSYKRYYNNILEVDARSAGSIAKAEYRFWSENLAQIFNIPKQMVHNYTLEDNVRDLLDRIARMRKLRIIEFPMTYDNKLP